MKVIALGATSATAKATARCYVDEGAELPVARQAKRLMAIAAALKLCGATRVETTVCDLGDAGDVAGVLPGLSACWAGSITYYWPRGFSAT